MVGEALAGLIAEVEGLGGTVTSVSGAGLVALFGAPEAHEDDPERAVRAGRRILSGDRPRRLPLRHGDAVGPCRYRDRAGGGRALSAPGPVTGRWGKWWARPPPCSRRPRRARSWSARSLVPPPRRSSSGGRLKRWCPPLGPSRSSPLTWSGQRRAPPATAANAGWRVAPPWWAAKRSWPCSTKPCARPCRGPARSCSWWASPASARPAWSRSAVSASWPGWAPAPAGCRCGWKAGRASYASSTPYGLYQQLLSAWVGAAPEEGEEVVRPALERAMKAIFGGQVDHVGLLAHMMGLPAGPEEAHLARLSPEGLQRATFAAVRAVVAQLGRERADGAGPGGPALGRPDIAAAHRGTGGTGR